MDDKCIMENLLLTTKGACDLYLQRSFPSWLFSVDQGATTVWERWNSYTKAEGFGDGKVYYYDHDPVPPANIHQLLLKSHGVELVTNKYSGYSHDNYTDFYKEAFADIKTRLAATR